MLEKIYQHHLKWINSVKKMGATQEEAEDIVGDMYLIIGKMLKKGLNITYGDDVNYYYIYKCLKTSYIQLKKKQSKENKKEITLLLDVASSEYVNFEEKNKEVNKELKTLHWYDQKIYNLIQEDYSITELSNKTNISYHSIYNTYRKVKGILKEKIK